MARTELERVYRHAREALMRIASVQPTCVMCAEAVWRRCHRRPIADDVCARGWNVVHLMGAGRLQHHALQQGAMLVDGVLRYPGPPGVSA